MNNLLKSASVVAMAFALAAYAQSPAMAQTQVVGVVPTTPPPLPAPTPAPVPSTIPLPAPPVLSTIGGLVPAPIVCNPGPETEIIWANNSGPLNNYPTLLTTIYAKQQDAEDACVGALASVVNPFDLECKKGNCLTMTNYGWMIGYTNSSAPKQGWELDSCNVKLKCSDGND